MPEDEARKILIQVVGGFAEGARPLDVLDRAMEETAGLERQHARDALQALISEGALTVGWDRRLRLPPE